MTLQRNSFEVHCNAIKEMLSIPSNDICADCSARHPLIINLAFKTFICEQCASAHVALFKEFKRPEMIHGVISALTTHFNHEELSRMRHISAGNKAVNSIFLADFDPSDPNSHAQPDADSNMELRKSWIHHKYIKKEWHRESHPHVDDSGIGYLINKFCSFLHHEFSYTHVLPLETDHRSERFSRDKFRNKLKGKKNITKINIVDKINRKRANMKIRNSNLSRANHHVQPIPRVEKIMTSRPQESSLQKKSLTENEPCKKEFKKIQCDDRVRTLMQYPFNKVCVDCATKSPHFLNLTLGSFVCERCAKLLVTISHEIAEISSNELNSVNIINANNEFVNAIYLALYNPLKEAHTPPNKNSSDSIRMAWIMKKYVLKTWYQSSDSSTITSDTYSSASLTLDSFDESHRHRPKNGQPDDKTIASKSNKNNIDAIEKIVIKDSKPQKPLESRVVSSKSKKHKHLPSILITSKGNYRSKSKRVTFKDECIS